MSACELAHSDAAYVLGALPPEERLAFERHLPGCEACRLSVAQLAGMPGLLARVPLEQVEAPDPADPVPATVLPALVSAVRREQRRRTVLVSLAAAAAVAVLAVGVAALQASRDDGGSPQAAPTSATTTPTPAPTVAPFQAMDVVVDYGVRAQVSLTEVEWGTKVGIDCRYAERDEGYTGHHRYRYNLVAITAGGRANQVASWLAEPGKPYHDWVTTATRLGQIQRLELQSSRGQTILRLEL